MINPHLMTPTYVKFTSRARGRKVYCPAFESHGGTRRCRHAFRTALRAKQHAQYLHARWCRLYDAAIAAQTREEWRRRYELRASWWQRLLTWIRGAIGLAAYYLGRKQRSHTPHVWKPGEIVLPGP